MMRLLFAAWRTLLSFSFVCHAYSYGTSLKNVSDNAHTHNMFPYRVAHRHLVDPDQSLARVSIRIQDTVHYQLDTVEADEEFAALLPAAGHLVRIPAEPDMLHTVALFHQLQCLDIIRRDYVHGNGTSPTGKHCLNYLRQTILCLADTKLEPMRNPFGPHTVVFLSDYECRDWNAVYSAADDLL